MLLKEQIISIPFCVWLYPACESGSGSIGADPSVDAAYCFAVSLLIALFYSRYLSKPVQKLGAASDKMANLDFSVRTDMKRIDEIGVLSRSLDTMAESLDQALSSLWEANAKLKDEMEQERELEQQRMEFLQQRPMS